MPTTPSANMLLPVPIVGVDPGPDYAQNVNNCFFFVDAHDHSPGKGLQITPSGLNINADLTFTNNSATNLKSTNFSSQVSVIATLRSLYVVGNNLYFTDGSGNSFPLTASGGVAGTPGSIGSLVAPASCTYVVATQTFVFAATATQAANLDAANIILRNTTSPFNGITLSAPLALASSYNIVLPPLPTGTNNFVVLDSSGNLSAPWKLDYSTLNVNPSNQIYANIANAEHAWELNGAYAQLSFPQTNIDSVFFAQTAISIQSLFIYSGSIGGSGLTEFDLKYKATPSSAWTSILSTTGKIAATTNLTSLGQASGVATATLNNHGFIAGDTVVISGVTATTVVTSLAASSGTCTVTLNAHGYIAGNYVTVSGASPASFNGTFVVATAATNTFTYSNPAVGTATATGTITITGYNGTFTVATAATNTFTYPVPSTLPASATGTPAVATRFQAYTDSGSVIGAQAGVTKPVVSTTSIPAGSVIRWDLLQSMGAGATDARIRMYYLKA